MPSLLHYGTVTIDRDSRYVKYQKIVAVPVEIEVPSRTRSTGKVGYT
ncbi:MAG: hypothetical protein M3530_08005 [Thermoproteota archaeon]|nr:hypothetical protein [Thermoproteota archaeon]